jgi:hypothetical protein
MSCVALLTGLLVLACTMAAPGSADCPPGFDPDSVMATLTSWQDLHRFAPLLMGCDDGEAVEGVSYFVVHTLATRWGTLRQLALLARADPRFGDWVIGHISALGDEGELQTIVRQARRGGPRTLRRRVLAAAEAALAKIHSMEHAP